MITFFSDPHIGLNRQAGTTPTTREIIRRNILKAIPIGKGYTICLGDLFDKYSNSEDIILSATEAYNDLHICLSGNHDLKNTADSLGSIQLLDAMTSENQLIRNDFGFANAFYSDVEGTKIISVPHCSTQNLFFDSLCQAEQMGGEILLLHCNFDAPAHRDLSETELNLSRENAEELLKVFKYILIGHEHNAAEHFGGRLKIVGGVYPTSFNDMKSKRYLTYENGEFTSHETWSKDNYLVLTWPYAFSVPDMPETEFIRITGTRKQSEGKDFLYLLNLLRKSGKVLAIKDDTVLEEMQTDFEGVEQSMTLVDSIRKALLEKPEELALWNELQEEITDA